MKNSMMILVFVFFKISREDLLEEPVRVSIVCAFILGDGQATQSWQGPLHCRQVLTCPQTHTQLATLMLPYLWIAPLDIKSHPSIFLLLHYTTKVPQPMLGVYLYEMKTMKPVWPSQRSTVWNMSVLVTPYSSAALRNWEICSICLKAMGELWIFFTGFSPVARLLISSLRIFWRKRCGSGETERQAMKDHKPWTSRLLEKRKKNKILNSHIHLSARSGILFFQPLAFPHQSRTDGWSTPPGSAPARGHTCWRSYPEPACSCHSLDLC